MILEIDAGNSRIKWRLIAEHQSAVVTKGVTGTAGTTALEEMCFELKPQIENIERVKVSSVRGDQFKAALVEMAKKTWQVEAEFARVEKSCAGVTNSYSDVSKMGVDRWLALLAAYKKAGAACCVLDCGSAITFDSVNAQGVHQGGYIVPGMQLMQEGLARKTPALDIPLNDMASLDPGLSTQQAIGNGIAVMVVGFAERCIRQFLHEQLAQNNNENNEQSKNGEFQADPAEETGASIFLTGGDALLVSKNLAFAHQVEKDLVLDGLAIALP